MSTPRMAINDAIKVLRLHRNYAPSPTRNIADIGHICSGPWTFIPRGREEGVEREGRGSIPAPPIRAEGDMRALFVTLARQNRASEAHFPLKIIIG